MQELLTPDDVFSHVLLLRSADERLILLVEGPTDCAVIDPHIERSAAQTIPGYGKATVIGVVTRANEKVVPRVAGLVDGDFDPVASNPYPANVFATDLYDIDAEVFFSAGVVERVSHSFGDRSRIRKHLESEGAAAVTDMIVPGAAAMGALRLVSLRDALGLCVRSLPVREFLDMRSGKCRVDLLVKASVDRTKTCRLSCEEICRRVEEVLESAGESMQSLCSGHDLAAVLACLARARWKASLGADQAEKAMRAALSCDGFAVFPFVVALARWANERQTAIWHERCLQLGAA